MRALSVLVLAGLAVAATAAADPLADFVAEAPKLEAALAHAPLQLREGQPCKVFDADDTNPPVNDGTPSASSPDGKAIALVATLDIDAAAAKRFGIPKELDAVVLVLDQGGGIRAFAPESFPRCDDNAADVKWSDDSHRLYTELDSGHGLRIALIDLARHRVIVDAFAAGDATPSPGLRHVAWVPWFAEWPEEHPADSVLSIDDRAVWHGAVSDLTWKSDDVLTFCAGGHQMRVRADRRGKPVRIGGC